VWHAERVDRCGSPVHQQAYNDSRAARRGVLAKHDAAVKAVPGAAAPVTGADVSLALHDHDPEQARFFYACAQGKKAPVAREAQLGEQAKLRERLKPVARTATVTVPTGE
jgi:hypothetical protein